MSWDSKLLGDTRIYTFVKSKIHSLPTFVDSFSKYMNHSNGLVEIYNQPDKQYLFGDIKYEKLVGYGPLLWSVAMDKEEVIMPVRLLTYARSEIACKNRGPDSYATLVDKVRKKAKEWYGEELGTSLSLIIIKTVEMAFLDDMEVEILTYKSIAKHKKRMIQHQKLREFEDTTPSSFFCGLFDWCFGSKDTSSNANDINLNWKTNVSSSYAEQSYKLDRSSTVIVNPQNIGHLPSTTVDTEFKEQRSDTSIKVPDYKTSNDREEALYVQGPIFSSSIPIVASSNIQNEEIAIRNRCINKVPIAEENIFDTINVSEYLDTSLYEQTDIVTFKSWNRSFPAARRQQHEKALKDLQENPLTNKDFTRKSFVKREKVLKSNINGLEPFDPRLIQGIGARCNVALGPEMKRFSKFLASQWSLDGPITKEYSILYASGYSNEQIGQWMQNILDNGFHFGVWLAVLGDDLLAVVRDGNNTYFISNDFSRFDTTIGVPALEFEQSIYDKCGIKGEAREVLTAQLSTFGYTRHGIQYSAPGGRKSGDPNTSCGNTVINGMVSMKVLTDLVKKNNLGVEQIRDSYLKYGFTAKPVIARNLYEVDFCSKLFWPTDTGIVLGPKPGRMLPKLGCGITKLSEQEFKGYMKGIEKDAHFVPGVAQYLELYDLKDATVSLLNPYTTHCTAAHRITPETIAFFENRYTGCSYEAICQSIKRLSLQYNLYDGQIIDELIKVDG